METKYLHAKTFEESFEELKLLLLKYESQLNSKEVQRAIYLFKEIIEWLLIQKQGDIKISAIDGKIGTKFRFDSVHTLPNT